MNNRGLIIGIVIIIAALGFGATTFKNSLVSYIPFSQAIAATNSTVQIMGAPVQGSMAYDSSGGALHFDLRSAHGQILPVIYHGAKPDDMNSAAQQGSKIAVQGTYNPAQRVFVAENLLVKCPSKYNGGTKVRSYGAT